MTKVTLANVADLTQPTTAEGVINNNSAVIVAAFDNTLSRNGTSPNQMAANLDMNSNRILNIPAPQSLGDPLRLADADLLNGSGTINALPTGGATNQILTKLSSSNYDVAWESPASVTTNLANFGGRLTPVSGTPVVNTDVIGSQNLYYAPFFGKTIPQRSGGAWSTPNFTSSSTDTVGLTLNLGGSTNWAANSIHDVFAVNNSGTLALGTRLWDAGMYPTTTQISNVSTITTGTTGTAWTRASAAFDGVLNKLGTNSAVISPVNSGPVNCLGQNWGAPQTVSSVVINLCSDHYLQGQIGPIDIRLQGSNDGTNWSLLQVFWYNDSTLNATFTMPINLDNQIPFNQHRVVFDGSSSNGLFISQIQFMKTVAASGGRRLVKYDGIRVNDASMTTRISPTTTITTPQYEGTYLGSIHIDTATAGQVSCYVNYGPNRTWGVWNSYNQKKVVLRAGILTTQTGASGVGYLLTSMVQVPCGGGLSGFTIEAFQGLAEEPMQAKCLRTVTLDCRTVASSYEIDIAVDNTSAGSGVGGAQNIDTLGQFVGQLPQAWLTIPPYSGIHTLNAVERTNTSSAVITVSQDPRETVFTAEYMA